MPEVSHPAGSKNNRARRLDLKEDRMGVWLNGCPPVGSTEVDVGWGVSLGFVSKASNEIAEEA